MVGDPRDISPWSVERGREAKSDWIGDQGRHDRDGPGCLACGVRWRAAVGGDDIDAQSDEFSSKPWKPVHLPVGKASFENDVGPLDIPTPRKFFLQYVERYPTLHRSRRISIGRPVEERANPIDSASGLRLRRAAGQEETGCQSGRECKVPEVHDQITSNFYR